MKKVSSRFLMLLICGGLWLSACGNTETVPKDKYSIQTPAEFVSEYDYDIYDNGLLYHDGDSLCFLDYQTMQGVPICNKPNCQHRDSSCVSRLCTGGGSFEPIVYQDHVYFFSAAEEIVDAEDGKSQTFQIHTKCMRANLHDGEVETFAEFEGLNPMDYMKSVVVDNMLYFIGSDGNPVQKENGSWSYRSNGGKQYLCSLNLDNGSFQQIGHINDSSYAKNNTIIEGNSVSTIYDTVEIDGIYQGKIYMHYRYVEDQQELIEACEIYGEDLKKLYDEAYVPWVIANRCYNLETGELTTSDLPYAKVIAENTYVYWDQEKERYVIRKADNTEVPAVGLQKAYQLYLVNQKLWSCIENEFYTAQCFDIASEHLYAMQTTADDQQIVMDYVDENYIVEETETGGVTFSEMPEKSLIGD